MKLLISLLSSAALTVAMSQSYAEALTPDEIFDAISGMDTFVEDAWAVEVAHNVNYSISEGAMMMEGNFWVEGENVNILDDSCY